MLKTQILENNRLFQHAGDTLQPLMQKHAVGHSLADGAFFVHEGDRSSHLALVGEGRLRVYKTYESGREITLYHVGPGGFCILNIIGLISGAPSPASALAVQPLDVVLIPGDLFRSWVSEYSEFREYVFATLSRQFVGLMALVEEVTFERLDSRLASFLLRIAVMEAGSGLLVSLTHDQIANEIGTVREVVSRLLKDLERRGILRLSRGQIRIVDRKALASTVGLASESTS